MRRFKGLAASRHLHFHLHLRRGIEEFWEGASKTSMPTGRAWEASELRRKSFEDLHKLWFVLLKERNFLETERHESLSQQMEWRNPERLDKVRQSMARLKTVLHERVLQDRSVSTPPEKKTL